MTFLFMMVTGSQTIMYFIPTSVLHLLPCLPSPSHRKADFPSLTHPYRPCSLMGQLGYRGTMVQYMTVPIYVVAAVFIIVIPFSSDIRKERPFHLAYAMAISCVSFAVPLGTANPTLQYVFLCFGVGSVCFFSLLPRPYHKVMLTFGLPLSPTSLSGIFASAPLVLVWTSNVISWPSEKRAIAQAFVNAMGNSASIYGSFLWPKNQAPRYIQGFATTLAMCAACGLGAVAMRQLVARYPYIIPEKEEVSDDTEQYGNQKIEDQK
jgi:hypothetical protein